MTWAWAVSIRRLARGRNRWSSESTICFAAPAPVPPAFIFLIIIIYELLTKSNHQRNWLDFENWTDRRVIANEREKPEERKLGIRDLEALVLFSFLSVRWSEWERGGRGAVFSFSFLFFCWLMEEYIFKKWLVVWA